MKIVFTNNDNTKATVTVGWFVKRVAHVERITSRRSDSAYIPDVTCVCCKFRCDHRPWRHVTTQRTLASWFNRKLEHKKFITEEKALHDKEWTTHGHDDLMLVALSEVESHLAGA